MISNCVVKKKICILIKLNYILWRCNYFNQVTVGKIVLIQCGNKLRNIIIFNLNDDEKCLDRSNI